MSNLGGRQWHLDAIAKAAIRGRMRATAGSMTRPSSALHDRRAGVRVLVDLPELGVAAGSEFLTLEAGQ